MVHLLTDNNTEPDTTLLLTLENTEMVKGYDSFYFLVSLDKMIVIGNDKKKQKKPTTKLQ